MLNRFFPFKPGNINLSDRCREKSLSLVKLSNPPAPSPPSIQPGTQKVSPSSRPPWFFELLLPQRMCLSRRALRNSVWCWADTDPGSSPPGEWVSGAEAVVANCRAHQVASNKPLPGWGWEDLILLFFFRTCGTLCPQVGLGHQQENSYSVLGKPHRAIGPQEENHSTSCNTCRQFSVSLWQGLGSGEEGQYKEDSGCCRGSLAWLTGRPLEWVLPEKILQFLSHWHKVLQGYFSIHELCVG